MLSIPLHSIAWNPQNDLFCVEWDVKQLLTYSLTLIHIHVQNGSQAGVCCTG